MKAILVMDMPSSCIKCPCCNIGAFYDICRVLNKTTNCSDNEKPDWCPLKPAPEKKDEDKVYTMTQLYRTQGYNACIDEILGDKE